MADQPSAEETEKSHRRHAIDCNNLAWGLSEKERTPIEDEQMLNAAHAAAFHWGKIGTELHRARANMLLGRAHALVGSGELALRFARASFDYLTTHEAPDWELAFAHAVLAHAAHSAKQSALHATHYAEAERLGAAILDPKDREIFLGTFRGIPAP
jgi:hypothetical protein